MSDDLTQRIAIALGEELFARKGWFDSEGKAICDALAPWVRRLAEQSAIRGRISQPPVSPEDCVSAALADTSKERG